MEFKIEKIHADNYSLFDDMIFWRETGEERKPTTLPVAEAIRNELENPNLHLYAAKNQNRYVGWISFIYLPKVGKWQGRGHIYIDEVWVAPAYRGQGAAKALMKKAEEQMTKQNAAGCRLYVNQNNPTAKKLYKSCGYKEQGQAIFMEKQP